MKIPGNQVQLKAHVPRELKLQLDRILYSELEGRVPFGAISATITTLLEEFIAKRKTVNRSLESELSISKEQSE